MEAEITKEMEQKLHKVEEFLLEAWNQAYEMYPDYEDNELYEIRAKIYNIKKEIGQLRLNRGLHKL